MKLNRRLCPQCRHSSVKPLNNNNQSDGTRYRRFRCNSCSHEWTIWELNEDQINYFRLLKKIMRHQCTECDGTTFQVVKTFPYTRYTLRQHKCRTCGANFFTREYIMDKTEYCWQLVNNKSKLVLRK